MESRRDPGSQPQVLIVEDNPISAKMMRVALEAEGYEVAVAGDGMAALEHMHRRPPALILQDLVLPDIDGLALVRQLRAAPAGDALPILACTGFLSRVDHQKLIDAGFSDYLFKPVATSDLVQTVRAYLPVPAARRIDGKGRRVLVADDDPLQLKLQRVWLQALGFEVMTAGDGEEALAAARQVRPDVIVSDVLMPRLDGFKLCLAVRDDPALAQVPVVLTSAAYTSEKDRELAHAAGASALVLRTPSPDSLAAALEAALAGPVPVAMPRDRVALAAEHNQRLTRQLERQVVANATLVQRLALHRVELEIVAGYGEVMTGLRPVDELLDELLQRTLNAAGVSKGAVYLAEGDGHLTVRAHIGYTGKERLPKFFGRIDLLQRAMETGAALATPFEGIADTEQAALLAAAGGQSILLAPIVASERRLGVLMMASATRQLSEDWSAFGKAVGSQMGHALALTQTFRELDRTRSQLERALSAGTTVIFSLEIAGGRATPLSVSGNVRGLLGYDAQETFAPGWWENGVHAEDRAKARENIRSVVEKGRQVSEYRFRCKDGSYRWLREEIAVVSAGADVLEVAGSWVDITDRKASETLLEERARLAHFVADTASALARHDDVAHMLQACAEAAVVHLGAAFARIWTLNASDNVLELRASAGLYTHLDGPHGRVPVGSFKIGRIAEERRPHLTNAVIGDPRVSDQEWAKREGMVAFAGYPLVVDDRLVGVLAMFSRAPLSEATLGALGSVSHHIAVGVDRKRSAEELDRQRNALAQTEKLAAMGTLLAGVAHEMNNPLSVVLGQAALLRRDARAGRLTVRADAINEAAQRCARIVTNFLALARQRPLERQRVFVDGVVREAVELLAYALRVDNVEVQTDFAPGVPVLWADPHQLHQVIVNLVTNAHHALRAVPGPRRIRLRTALASAPGFVQIRVEDNGPGVPAALRARIFEPFFTTKPPGQGTGLGLSLCHGIIETHGGTLRLGPETGRGAVFEIELPLGRALDSSGPAAAAPSPGSRIVGKRMLIVDDEEALAMVLADILAEDGHTVDIAPNGAAALDLLARGGVFDVIVSDIRMPDMDGPTFYRQVETRFPAMAARFVFMTGDALRVDTMDFLEQIGAPRLEKPFRADAACDAVQLALRGSK